MEHADMEHADMEHADMEPARELRMSGPGDAPSLVRAGQLTAMTEEGARNGNS
jgi:hypothetical protein